MDAPTPSAPVTQTRHHPRLPELPDARGMIDFLLIFLPLSALLIALVLFIRRQSARDASQHSLHLNAPADIEAAISSAAAPRPDPHLHHQPQQQPRLVIDTYQEYVQAVTDDFCFDTTYEEYEKFSALFFWEDRGAAAEDRAERAECVICLDGFAGGDVCLVMGECEHVFHKRCGDSWMEDKRSCPVCRKQVTEFPS
uniref:RING-type E3 ubiquitin transferase n=1 Tax=Kalanchoe fedtschenkoi TaxID=63787 RepID=A0A7N0RE97_KALFE